MPLYEYDCRRCGARVEVLVRHGQADPQSCGDDCVSDLAEGDGPLVRRLALPGGYQDGGQARAASAAEARAESCGTCGGIPGSCAYNN